MGRRAPRGRQSTKQDRGDSRSGDGWARETFKNPENRAFERYYKTQEIVPVDQWEDFMSALKRPLPTSFRITSCRPDAQDVNAIINEVYVPFLTNVVFEGEKVEAPQQIPWYPGHLAWQLNVQKQVIRKSEHFARFQSFLVHETEVGNISRQEVVSMVPPVLLDVQPDHFVLDCCAAPGSKSAQLLEALHSDPVQDPKGFLIANDNEMRRTQMLVHQSLNRIGSPNMLVTNHDASQFPNLRIKDGEGGESRGLLFDRILADVPCSGDGTLRKNLAIWNDWNLGNGLGLHNLQLRILNRAIKLLRPGGRVVYSTCSLNPVENEAVISAALAANPEMSLVDVSERLSELKRRPGMTKWKVMVADDNPLDRPQDESILVGNKKLTKSLWPDGKECERHLERCIRIYPHLQDTGGFFVAVLSKSAKEADVNVASDHPKRKASEPAPEEPPKKRAIVDTTDASAVAPAAVVEAGSAAGACDGAVAPPVDDASATMEVDDAEKAADISSTERKFKEDPCSYVSADHPEIKACLDFFDIRPTFDSASLMVRNDKGEPTRTIYRTSPSVKAVIIANSHDRLRIVSSGTKLFGRQDSGTSGNYSCRWRVMNDAILNMTNQLGRGRILTGGVRTLRQLMKQFVGLDEFTEPEFAKSLKELSTGSAFVEVLPCKESVQEGEPDGSVRNALLLPIWRAPNSVQLMLDKKEKLALSFRCFGADITIWNPTKPGAKKVDGVEEGTGDVSVAGLTAKGGEATTKPDGSIEQPPTEGLDPSAS